jgi:hypothetical protein
MTSEDAILLACHIRKFMKKENQTPIMEGLVLMYEMYVQAKGELDDRISAENHGDNRP